MDAPLRRNDSLFIVHPYMTCLLRLTHEMANRCILRELEIEVDFHPAVVSMGRHSIPGATRSKLCHPHLKLAAWNHLFYK
jgi:hypothetical protein